MKVKNKHCDEYGFRLKDLSISKRKDSIAITALYKNYYTSEDAFFTINMDRKSYNFDIVRLSALKAELEEKSIVDAFIFLLDAKGTSDTYDNLVSEFPESIILNHHDIVNKIIARYSIKPNADDDISKAFSERRQILLDAIKGVNS